LITENNFKESSRDNIPERHMITHSLSLFPIPIIIVFVKSDPTEPRPLYSLRATEQVVHSLYILMSKKKTVDKKKDQWIEIITTFVNNVCTSFLLQSPSEDVDILKMGVTVVLINAFEAQHESVRVEIFELIDVLWNTEQYKEMLKADSRFNHLILSLLSRSPLLQDVFVYNQVKVLAFVMKVLPEVMATSAQEKKVQLVDAMRRNLKNSEKILKLDQNAHLVVDVLIGLCSVLLVALNEPVMKIHFQQHISNLVWFKTLLDDRANNGWAQVQNIEKLVSLVSSLMS